MAGDKGVEGSSEAVSQPPSTSAAAGFRAVFLSYASPDAEIANTVCQFLESHGISCWMAPRDVKPGSVYADAIVRAINEAKALVLVLSGAAMASAHVGREVERAASKHKQIVPFRTDTSGLSPEFEYFLSNSQWIDVPALGMPAALVNLKEAVGSATLAQVNPALGSGDAPSRATINHAVSTATAAKRAVVAATVVIAFGIGGTLAVHFWPSKRGDAAPPVAAISDKSIAVLPFADMSEGKDQEYFADGMAEEVLDLLANIPGMTVIGRTSSFQFKKKNDDLRTIGTKLNVAHVLEGSVRKSGDRVRVTAQLIDTRTGAHEWSESFDRNLGDVLKLQDEIAAGLARALEVTVSAGDLQPRGAIKDAEAYQFYLRGRHAYDRSDRVGLDEAAADFHQALDLEPAFANAAAYLAKTRAVQAANGFINYTAGYEDARRLAEIAIRLDSSLAFGHGVLADYYTRFAWDWKAADREAKRALELDSRGVFPLDVSANLATTLGHWDEAVRLLNTALELDPLSAELYWDLGNARYRSNRFAEAEAAFRHVLQISPTFVSAHFELGRVLLERGQLRDALSEMEQESPEPESGRTSGLVMAYHALGRRADSDAALKRLEAESGDDWPFGMAEAYAFRGEADRAIQWLDRAYKRKDELELIKGDPSFRKVEQDPRYKAFLRKMNLPE